MKICPGGAGDEQTSDHQLPESSLKLAVVENARIIIKIIIIIIIITIKIQWTSAVTKSRVQSLNFIIKKVLLQTRFMYNMYN